MVVAKKQRVASTKAKGKGKTETPKAAPPPKEPTPEVEEEEDDSDFDEETGGVSENDMKRLMELVDEEDLDEYEHALMGGEDEDEDEEDEEDDDEEDGEEEDEEEDNEAEEEDAEEEGDNSIVMDVADPDTVAVDELGSDVSVDEDAVPMRKITTSNKPAMRILTEGIKMTHTAWPEHLIQSSKTVLDVDPSDDLARETAFYKIALEAVPGARKLAAKFDIPFSRPNDYYAEMVKSDEHMERIRTKLVDEAQGIKKSEEAKKQRDLKKYGKQIQQEKLKQRDMDKKAFNERMAGVKRKRKDGAEMAGEDDDEFGIQIDDDDEPRGGSSGRGGRAGNKPKMPRHARDAKYKLGGGGRRSKQNTKDSANDFGGFGSEHKKKGPAGAKTQQRPGKARRHSRRK